jgi:hypothetical protein
MTQVLYDPECHSKHSKKSMAQADPREMLNRTFSSEMQEEMT